MTAALATRLRGLATLVGVALAAGLLISALYTLTEDRIAANERARQTALLTELLPPGEWPGLLESRREVRAEMLAPSGRPVDVYTSVRPDGARAAVLTVVAPDGYSGPIRLLVGVDGAGTVTGVRVVAHRETPGLGDAIEAGRSDWIERFEGESLVTTPAPAWTVRREGGAYDAISGATVTSRAVIGAVRRALLYFGEHRDSLFAPAPT